MAGTYDPEKIKEWEKNKRIARRLAEDVLRKRLGIQACVSDAISDDIAPEIDGHYEEDGIGVTEFWGQVSNHTSQAFVVEQNDGSGEISFRVESFESDGDFAPGMIHHDGNDVDINCDIDYFGARQNSETFEYEEPNGNKHKATFWYWDCDVGYSWSTC